MRKRLLGLLAVAAALAVALALVLPRLVAGEALRETLVAEIEQATGARVELGAVRVRVLPRLSVQLEGGAIHGTGSALAARRGAPTDIVDYAAEIGRLEARLAVLPLLRRQVTVSAVRLEAPRLALTLPRDRIELVEAEVTVRELALVLPDPGAPGRGEFAGRAAGTAELHAARLTVGGADYDDVRAEAVLADRVLTLDPVRARRGDGEITGSATFDYAGDPGGVLAFQFDARGVPAVLLLAPWAPEVGDRLETALDARGRGGCLLRDSATATASLGLEGTMTAGAGVLHAGDWLREAVPYLGERRDLVDVRFRDLDHAFRVTQGRYVFDELEIDGEDTDWQGTGWIGFADAIDLDLSVKLPPGFTPELGQWSFLANTLRDEEGRVQLDLQLTGRSSAPKVGLDLTRLVSAAHGSG